MKKLLLSVAALALSFSSNAAETLTIGATPVPHVEILEVVKPDLKSQGIDLKIVEFNDYVQPNTSVSDKLLDLNFFQHRPYLDSFIKDHGSDLVEVGGIHIEPIGFYSHKIKDLKDLKKGATIAIPNDPTNGGRALLLLQTAGLITLEDPKSISATPLDIKDNKLNLNIKELEAPQLPRSLDDQKIYLAVINTTYASQVNLTPAKDGIFVEDKDSPYVNIIVAREDNKDSENVKKFIQAYQTDEVDSAANKIFNGGAVKGW